LENKIGKNDFSYRFSKKFDKKTINFLLDQTKISNPEYLTDTSNENSIFKKLDYDFEWCALNVLDSYKSEDYSGIFAFIAFLTGLSTSNKLSTSNLIHILRIRHQVSGVDGYFYSYAILNECYLFGGSDLGWIVFLTCATDYSGHGGSMHALAEFYIEKYEKEGKLSVKQIDVDEKTFRNYLKTKLDEYHNILEDEGENDSDDISFYETINSQLNEGPEKEQNNQMPQEISSVDSLKKKSILEHKFKIALSFSGKHRSLVKEIADGLTTTLGKNSVFYDNYYRPHLDRINLDLALQKIYKDNSELIVVFLSSDYGERNWCKIEYRIIRELLFHGHDENIMLLKVENCEIDGLCDIDGYLPLQEMNKNEIIESILQRFEGFE